VHQDRIADKVKDSLRALKHHWSKFSLKPAPSDLKWPAIQYDAFGVAQNFQHGVGVFYGPDGGQAYSAKQVAIFTKDPDCFHPQVSVSLKEDSLFCEFADRLDAKMGDKHMREPMITREPGRHFNVPINHAPILVIFGVGLGHHILPLIDFYEISMLIICETDPTVLAACLAAQDWRRIVDKCKRRGIVLKMIYRPSGEKAAYDVMNTIRDSAAPGLVGARIFQHYFAYEQGVLRNVWKQTVGLLNTIAGYFVDEFRQCLQVRKNLIAGNAVLTRVAPPLPYNHVAVVVGSGPSLDLAWDLLASIRDRVYLISCGSALAPLRARGYTPDIHVEMETHPSSGDVVSFIDDREIYDNVPLIAPASGYPKAIEQFKHRYLFARETSCSTMLFDGAAAEVRHAFARVGNGGAALAFHLGFQHVVMLGMDTGYRRSGNTHAAATVHKEQKMLDLDKDTYAGIESEDLIRDLKSGAQDAPFQMVSIDGEPLYADPLFAFSKSSFVQLVLHWPDRKLYQVGAGAKIDGAAANVLPHTFTLPTAVKVLSVEHILSRANPIDDLAKSYQTGMDRAAKTSGEITRKTANIFDREYYTPVDFVQAVQTFYDLTREYLNDGPEGGGIGLVRSTSMTFARGIMERAMLLDDPDAQMQYLREGTKVLVDMIVETSERIEREFMLRENN
jgi:hypothetical protein